MYDDLPITSDLATTGLSGLVSEPVVTSETLTTTTTSHTFYINDEELIQKADSALNFLHIITYLLCITIIAVIVNWLWKQFKSLLGTY